jgi:hypothetical protein
MYNFMGITEKEDWIEENDKNTLQMSFSDGHGFDR